MCRPPVATSVDFRAWSGNSGTNAQVEGVVLLGVPVVARVVIDVAEHQRRQTAGLTSVTNPALLDRLLNLPLAAPVSDPLIWTQMAHQAPGIIERSEDGATVERLLSSPLAIVDVVARAAVGGELAAVQNASLFAGFARRWISAVRSPLPDAVQLEAKLCGVGILDRSLQVLVPAEAPATLTVNGWSWLLQEKVYRRWLSVRPRAREMESQPPATGEANVTQGG